MGSKEINDYTEQTTLNTTDEILLQETGGGTTKKTLMSTISKASKITAHTGMRVIYDVATFNYNALDNNGAIKITLPASWTSTMMMLEIDIYNYFDDYSVAKLLVSGYTPTYASAWYTTDASMVGRNAFTPQVRFGHDGTYCCIIIGDVADVGKWDYPKVVISKATLGYYHYDSRWDTGWTIGFITSESGITVSATETDLYRYVTSNLSYTGTTASNLTFPIGTILSVEISGGAGDADRNATRAIYIDSVTDYQYRDVVNGTALTGTWNCRGRTSSNYQLFQRTA